MDRRLKTRLLAGVLALPFAAFASFASAQERGESTSAEDEEIVVTARGRAERPLESPVVVSAYTGAELLERGVADVPDIARITPQLTIEPNLSNFGGAFTLRGVTSPTSNVASDWSVTLNVDGVPLNSGPVMRLGQFDLGQVEVLRGPQALFFGKNATGGIVSLISANPSNRFETRLSAGYEGYAQAYELEGVVSGPLTNGVLGRLAVRWSEQEGFFENDAPGVRDRHGPNDEEIGVRGTLLFEPNDDLRVRLIGYYSELETGGAHRLEQRIHCPTGAPQGPAAGTANNCSADESFITSDLPSNFAQVHGEPLFRDGVGYSEFEQTLGVLDARYSLPGGLTLTSITGYYGLEQANADNASHGPVFAIADATRDVRSVWSEEIRLASDPEARFDWIIGAFFQNDQFKDYQRIVFASGTPLIPGNTFWIDGTTSSVFAQASFDITDHLVLSAGARYTEEIKEQEVSLSPKFNPRIEFEDTSPEVTLSYHPNENTNLYLSYREGYKSGGFHVNNITYRAAALNPAVALVDNSYREEHVDGFEAGLKVEIWDGDLRLDTAIYSYGYEDLQLTSFDPVLAASRVNNAASATVEGMELNFRYRPPVEGLTLHGSIAYNEATYDDFHGACYVGQTIAGGCTIDGPDAGTTPDLQDLSGRALARAPEWAGNLGFDYDRAVGAGYNLSLGADVIYQSEYFLAQESAPWGVKPDTTLFDARAAFGPDSDAWELAFIGKNLTDEIYPVSGFQETFTGSAASTGTTMGVPGDYGGIIRRGREVWVRFTLRPNQF